MIQKLLEQISELVSVLFEFCLIVTFRLVHYPKVKLKGTEELVENGRVYWLS
jgi:hypothetical protein